MRWPPALALHLWHSPSLPDPPSPSPQLGRALAAGTAQAPPPAPLCPTALQPAPRCWPGAGASTALWRAGWCLLFLASPLNVCLSKDSVFPWAATYFPPQQPTNGWRRTFVSSHEEGRLSPYRAFLVREAGGSFTQNAKKPSLFSLVARVGTDIVPGGAQGLPVTRQGQWEGVFS